MRRVLSEGRRGLSQARPLRPLDDQAHGATQMTLGLIQRRLRLAEPETLQQQKGELHASAGLLQGLVDLLVAAARQSRQDFSAPSDQFLVRGLHVHHETVVNAPEQDHD